VLRPPAAAADATPFGSRLCYYGWAPQLLVVLLYSQFCD